MSPVNIYRPRGFAGGFDHRFVKPFQAATGAPPFDPLAGVHELHARGISVKQSAHSEAGTVTHSGVAATGWVVQHGYGINLEVYQIG